MGFGELARRMQILNDSKFTELVHEVLNELSPEIIRLNKLQLEKGERSDGSFLREYSSRTIAQRQREGNPVKGSLIALYDSGEFWGGFWSIAYNNKLELLSKDVKTNMLVKEYGDAIFGLTKTNFETIGDAMAEKLKQEIGKFLQQ